MRPLLLEITIVTAQRTTLPPHSLEVLPTERIVAIVQRLLVQLGSNTWPGEWNLLYQGARLPLDGTIGMLVPEGATVVQLVLCPESETAPPIPSDDPDDSGLDLAFEDRGEIDYEKVEAKPPPTAPPLPSPAAPPPAGAGPPASAPPAEASERTEAAVRPGAAPDRASAGAPPAYHATVRYYNRMNPQRVYPLLVMLGKDMIERIQKPGADQRVSSPFRADPRQAIEVEPILPGCACHPPKQTTRLGGNVTLTFHVVPHVLGDVTGAVVVVRQDHADLARVALDARVIQRTSALVCGALTVVVPFASSILRHVGLDLDARAAGGFNVAVELLRLLLQIPPAVVVVVLGSLTGVLFWLTRPRARDVFWEATPVTREDMLERIMAQRDDDPDGAAEALLDLLTAHPDYQPAWLQYAQWHYESQDYETAREGYDKAFALGAARSNDYVRAALAASRLGRNREALDILHSGEKVLPAGRISGILLFNMGCYHARLGEMDRVVPCLRRAVSAGYRKRESFLEDADLAPVRGRADFQELVAELARAGSSLKNT